MKRKALKGLNWMGYYVASFGCGYLFGKLIGKIFSRVLTEEVMKTKPVLFWGMYILFWILIIGSSIIYAIANPLGKLVDLINSKIDDFADDKEWD